MTFSQNLDGVLTSGWYDDFKTQLKYITLQHYPQNKYVCLLDKHVNVLI